MNFITKMATTVLVGIGITVASAGSASAETMPFYAQADGAGSVAKVENLNRELLKVTVTDRSAVVHLRVYVLPVGANAKVGWVSDQPAGYQGIAQTEILRSTFVQLPNGETSENGYYDWTPESTSLVGNRLCQVDVGTNVPMDDTANWGDATLAFVATCGIATAPPATTVPPTTIVVPPTTIVVPPKTIIVPPVSTIVPPATTSVVPPTTTVAPPPPRTLANTGVGSLTQAIAFLGLTIVALGAGCLVVAARRYVD